MTYKKLIDETHPMAQEQGPELDRAFDAGTLAMKLVGERHSKRDLVDLVRWLIMKRPELILENEQGQPQPPKAGVAGATTKE